MAPISSDPKDLLEILNPARRRALVQVVGQITSHMRHEIEDSFHSPTAYYQIAPPHQRDVRGGSNAPLFIDKYDMTPKERSSENDVQTPRPKLERSISSPKVNGLRIAALRYFDGWERSVRDKLKELMNTPQDPRQRPPPLPPRAGPSAEQSAENRAFEKEAAEAEAKELASLQSLYEPIQTRLATVSKQDRKTIISSMLLLLLSLQHYSSHSRVLLCYLTSSLDLPLSVLITEETETTQSLLLASKSSASESMSASTDTAVAARANSDAVSRRWKVGLASVAGAALIGVTGGLAAPVVAAGIGTLMGGVGLGGLASFLGIFAMNGVFMGSLFGVVGGKMMGQRMEKYTKSVEDFKFVPIVDNAAGKTVESKDSSEEEDIKNRRLRVTIGINGWLTSEEDVVKPWKVLGDDSEVFALRYELNSLINLGTSLNGIAPKYAWRYVKYQVVKRTVLATVSAAMWPVALLSAAGALDTPFALAKNRSEKAGEVLADALINKTQGERPVTLIGYSLGSRVIYACLRELAERKAFGLVESVVMIGSPVPSDTDNWRVMKSVVSGKMINVFSENDYILGFMYRATSIQLGVAGLQEITDITGIKNIDLTQQVSGHLRYPDLIGKILKKAGFANIKVDDDGNIEQEKEDEDLLVDLTGDTDLDAEEVKISQLGNDSVDARIRDAEDDMSTAEIHRNYIEAEEPSIQRIGQPQFEGSDAPEVLRAYVKADFASSQLIDNEDTGKIMVETMTQLHIAPIDYDSDDAGGGIQMIDNDIDSEDNDYPHEAGDMKPTTSTNNTALSPDEKVQMLREPKSLGSFPRQ